MTWSLLIFSGLAFFLAVLLLLFLYRHRMQILSRLRRIRAMENDDEAMLDRPFKERVIEPAGKSILKSMLQVAPREIKHWVQKQLVYAGNPWGLNVQKLFFVQIMAASFLLLAVLLTGIYFGIVEQIGMRSLILVSLAGFLLPLVVIRHRVLQRQDEISKAIPMMLDLLLISVEAGMSLDVAMRRVSVTINGPLKSELQRFHEEVQVGKPRSDALKGMVDRTGVEDLWLFTISIIQAEQRWGHIADALEKQAHCLRRKRRRRAEEEARKAPLKMLFPLIFFVFPALLVVLLGPALLVIVSVFRDLL